MFHITSYATHYFIYFHLIFVIGKETNSYKDDDDEKDRAEMTPQKLAEDLELEVLLLNEQNLILNSLSGVFCDEYDSCLSECKQWYDNEEKCQQLIVPGYNRPEKDVCEYKDVIQSNYISNNQVDAGIRRVTNYEDKFYRINTELRNERCTLDHQFNERISSPSSDDSSSTVEGAAAGIPYILKNKLNEKQKKKKQIYYSADHRMRHLSKRNIKHVKQHSEYLKSPSSDTSDEDPKVHNAKFTFPTQPAGNEIWHPENVLELHDQINERLKIVEYPHDNLHWRTGINPQARSHRLAINTTQTYTTNNNARLMVRTNQDLVYSGYNNRASQQPDNQTSRRPAHRREQYESENQNHFVAGGARPKNL